MKAIVVDKQQHLVIEEVDAPALNAEEILIRVAAIGVNSADLMQRQGRYPPPEGASPILGLEAAGTVLKLGSKSTRFKIGDRVMCLVSGGAYAELISVHEKLAMPIPKNLGFIEAASIPEVFLTAFLALFFLGKLRANQWVLIHAGGSGVGTAAGQLVKAGKAKSISTSRSKEKTEKSLKLGADAAIQVIDSKFSARVLTITNDHGADIILDFIGASYFEENMRSIAQGGTQVLISTLGGREVEKFDLGLLMRKWITLAGTTLRNRPLEYKAQLIEEFSKFALKKFESGELKPIIGASFPWEQAELAHEQLSKNQVFGKVVLTIMAQN
jgi:tumor protein p53-inducible protein 3